MKLTSSVLWPALGLLAALAASFQMDAQTPAPRYIVTDLGKPGLGGPVSMASGLSNMGRVGGQAMRPNGDFHGFLSGIGHTLIDLGTLGGPNSTSSGPNLFGALAVDSDTKTKDPLGEDFCAFGTHLICLGAVWQEGVLTPLAALGGNNSAPINLNNFGQLVGLAETATQDPTCATPGQPSQVLRYQGVVWGPGPGEIHPLPPLPGDTVSFALAINDVGQVVGSSGTCANAPGFPFPVGPHAVLWENGVPRDLGSLNPGGSPLNVGAGINNRGEVVGGSQTSVARHTFLWTAASGMQDLGTLEKDLGNLPGSGLGAINNNGQVVGISCINSAFCDMSDPEFMARAYLWQNGTMMDLNSLVVGGAPLYLIFAFQINDGGEIAGFGATADGDLHAFVATPLHGSSGGGHTDSMARPGPMVLGEDARKSLRRQLPNGRAR